MAPHDFHLLARWRPISVFRGSPLISHYRNLRQKVISALEWVPAHSSRNLYPKLISVHENQDWIDNWSDQSGLPIAFAVFPISALERILISESPARPVFHLFPRILPSTRFLSKFGNAFEQMCSRERVHIYSSTPRAAETSIF